MTQPIRVWVVPPGPNPWKVIYVLEELGLPYTIKSIKFEDVKKPPMTDVNPNGRVPAIEDPNTGLTLWESGAILTYLVEQYDAQANKISFSSLHEKHIVNQYLHFQVSGQGPYFGPAGWFRWLHPEKIQSAIDRYTDQTTRVLGVLEGLLEGKDWLVGDRMTIADMAFVPWNDRVDTCLGCAPEDKFKGFPRVQAWHERMIALPSWKAAMDKRAVLMDEQGLMWNGMPKGTTSFQEYEDKIKAGES